MKVLKAKSKRPPHQVIGLSIPSYIHEYFTLYIIAKRLTKTKILKPMIDEWYRTQRINDTDSVLIDMIIQQCIDKRLDEFKELSGSEFKGQIKHELEAKRLKPEYIIRILSQLKD